MSTNLILGVAFVAFIGYMFFKRKAQAAAAKKLMETGALIIDVRSPGEYAGGNLNGSKNMPVGELSGKVKEIERLAKGKAGGIVVYCASGARSSQAKRILDGAGFTQVVNGGAYGALA